MGTNATALRGRVCAAIVGVAVLLVGLSYSTTSSANAGDILEADYLFQNTLGGGSGAPDLTPLGAGGYATETVDGNSSTVWQFPAGDGLSLSPVSSIIANNSYSIVALLRIAETTSYRRLIDFKNGTSDHGIYNYGDANAGYLYFYGPSQGTTTSSPIVKNEYVQVAVTREPDGDFRGYVNGTEYINFNDTGSFSIIDGDTLRFFRDNGNGEHSAGAIARLRIYSAALSSSEIAGLDRLPSSGPPPTSSPPPTSTPTQTPTTTPTTTPSPSATPTTDPTPTPTPTTPPTVAYQVKRDGDDTPGKVDIRLAAFGVGDGFFAAVVETHNKIRRRILKIPRPNKAVIWMWFDTIPDTARRFADYRVRIYFFDGAWEGRVEERTGATWRSFRVVQRYLALKLDKFTLGVAFDPANLFIDQDAIFWYVQTGFRNKTKCKPPCYDFAPQRNWARYPLP